MDTMTAWALGLVTMNPTALTTTAAGDMATKWRRFAAVTIVPAVEVAANLRTLTDPRLLPARCRLFRRGHGLIVHRSHVLVVRRSRVMRARDHVKVRPESFRVPYVGKKISQSLRSFEMARRKSLSLLPLPCHSRAGGNPDLLSFLSRPL